MFEEKQINELFKNPALHDWTEHHTGTGAMTQDGSVVISNDEDLIAAASSTVYQFDHFDKATGKYVFKLASNQFKFVGVSIGSLKENGVRFDIDDETLWNPNITVTYIAPIVGVTGLYGVPRKNAAGNDYEYKLRNLIAGSQTEIYTNGSLEMGSIFEHGFLNTLKNIFLDAGCTLTEDGYQAIIPGKYLEIVKDTSTENIIKISLLPQEIAIAPSHEPVFRLLTTQE